MRVKDCAGIADDRKAFATNKRLIPVLAGGNSDRVTRGSGVDGLLNGRILRWNEQFGSAHHCRKGGYEAEQQASHGYRQARGMDHEPVILPSLHSFLTGRWLVLRCIPPLKS